MSKLNENYEIVFTSENSVFFYPIKYNIQTYKTKMVINDLIPYSENNVLLSKKLFDLIKQYTVLKSIRQYTFYTISKDIVNKYFKNFNIKHVFNIVSMIDELKKIVKLSEEEIFELINELSKMNGIHIFQCKTKTNIIDFIFVLELDLKRLIQKFVQKIQ